MIHPLLRGADPEELFTRLYGYDSSPPARDRLGNVLQQMGQCRFIPSCEGHTWLVFRVYKKYTIHPLLQGSDLLALKADGAPNDSSPPARGKPHFNNDMPVPGRFIPSCEEQTERVFWSVSLQQIHPLLRGANNYMKFLQKHKLDSSPPARGKHSVFMRLSAALNTSLCNLHKCHSWLIHIFNMPKNPPHFHFFSNHFFVFQLPSPETFRLRMI